MVLISSGNPSHYTYSLTLELADYFAIGVSSGRYNSMSFGVITPAAPRQSPPSSYALGKGMELFEFWIALS